MRYKISEVSNKLDISQRRIIEYEKLGLIKVERQPRTNDRLFTEFEVLQIGRIRDLIHNHGFTLTSLLYLMSMAPCWKIFDCRRYKCPAYLSPHKPCWKVNNLNKNSICLGDCYRCVVYLAQKKAKKIKLLARPKKNGK